MRTLLILLICTLIFYDLHKIPDDVVGSSGGSSLPSRDTIDFKIQVQPILQKNCIPCHFPGGKMYEKMPFDTASTILNHEAGILKRIKDEASKKLIRDFIQQETGKTESKKVSPFG